MLVARLPPGEALQLTASTVRLSNAQSEPSLTRWNAPHLVVGEGHVEREAEGDTVIG
jgi:hypothetical protein